jgi:hypothetical protein
VTLDDFLANGQPHPGTRVFIPGVQPLEDDKDALGKLLIQADTVVRDREQPLVFLPLHANVDLGESHPACGT